MNTVKPVDASREWHHPPVGFRRVARTETDEEAFERHVLPEIEVLFRVARSMTHHHAEILAALEDCRRCGLEGETYEQIKRTLTTSRPEVPEESVKRLREFGRSLIHGGGATAP